MKPYYEKRNVTIYHGDCAEVLPLLPKYPLVITDPPYALGNNKRQEWSASGNVAVGITRAAESISSGGAMLCFTTTSGRGMAYTLGAVGNSLRFNRLLVWHKDFVNSAVAGPWRWDAVAVLCFGRATFGRPQYSSVCKTGGYKASTADDHPSEIPVAVAEWLYLPFADENEIVLDPFMGTGSLLIPAAERNKKVVGIEINEAYCELAAKRLDQDILPFEESA